MKHSVGRSVNACDVNNSRSSSSSSSSNNISNQSSTSRSRNRNRSRSKSKTCIGIDCGVDTDFNTNTNIDSVNVHSCAAGNKTSTARATTILTATTTTTNRGVCSNWQNKKRLLDDCRCIWRCWFMILLIVGNIVYVSMEFLPTTTTTMTMQTFQTSKLVAQQQPEQQQEQLEKSQQIKNNHEQDAIMRNTNRTIAKNENFMQANLTQQIPTLRPTTTATTTIATTVATTIVDDDSTAWQIMATNEASALAARRYAREANEEAIDRCRLFTEGDPNKNELYSPDYPNLYPKSINCTRVITAPKGQIIRLDFRNSFHIEAKEDCKFDFLEIRDGQYGFSSLLGKFCGTDFPPEITSKERYLWLHFHSDETIEYSGFSAVYEFLDRSRETPSTDLNCTIEKDGYQGYINASDVPPDIRETVIRNKIPLDCIFRIQVQEKWKIQLKFLDFHLSKPNDCESNFLDIFPEQTVMPLRVKNFCGSAGESITADSNILHMRFYAEQIAINSTFSILFTAFRDRGAGCTEEEYDCEDATCISKDLQCNGMHNCKFSWDEEGCQTQTKKESDHVTIIIIVFGLILGGMVSTFVFNCIRKIIRDQKIIREHIRESKESKLDEMGRNSKARSRENISRQKHSQTSLQILDDVSNRYYREAVPISAQTSKADFKEKEHSILRHHNDMTQTSLCSGNGDADGMGVGMGMGMGIGDDESSTTTNEMAPVTLAHLRGEGRGSVATASGVPLSMVNACDMGCQTRESLFATAPPTVATLMRQKSTTSSLGGAIPPPPPQRYFSTFGYDQDGGGIGGRGSATPPVPMPPTVPAPTTLLGTLTRRSASRTPQRESLEMEERHSGMGGGGGGGRPTHHYGLIVASTAKPQQEICHHHHQHQQHLQQQQQQQQQQLQQQQLQQQQQHHQQPQQHKYGATAAAAAARLHHQQQLQQMPQSSQQQHDDQQHPQHQHHQQQQQQQHLHHHQQSTPAPAMTTATRQMLPPMTMLKGSGSGSGGGGGGGVGGGGPNTKAGKPIKNEESKVFIDIRNSAPDVIIMTSH